MSLADPNFNKSTSIDLLIGAEHFWQIIGNEEINIFNKQVHLRETAFGWVVAGKIANTCTQGFVGCTRKFGKDEALNQQLTKFWEMEEQVTNTSTMSVEELACERHFYKTVRRDPSGRFVVRLPFKTDVSHLDRSDNIALKQFHSLENRLNNKPQLKSDYIKFMQEYTDLGHMQLITNSSDVNVNKQYSYYLPHHAVVKESSSTTRVRVVFNASSKTSTGISLNNILMVGPTVQQSLFSIITRFRTHQFAFTCDIVKMYRQKMWSYKLEWDDPLPKDLYTQWPEFSKQLHLLNSLTIPRKAVKYHLKGVVANALLSYEELLTVLAQIEACVNSRPLTPLYNDTVDISPLTPGHFIIGDTLATTAEPDLTTTKENRLSRWQRVQQITQNFWKRWSKEFLNTLQQRSKWRERCTNQAKPGLPVLLKEENLHPLCWKMGVIKEVYPGKDGTVRTVIVKTNSGEVSRAVNRICPFPPEEEDVESHGDSRGAGCSVRA
mgnify:FL=1